MKVRIGKKIIVIFLLLGLTGSIFIPLQFAVSFSSEMKTLIMELDVCHSQGAALAADSDTPTFCECPCSPEPAESCGLPESVDFTPDQAIFARQIEPPPRYQLDKWLV
jgi:hypothetical protein